MEIRGFPVDYWWETRSKKTTRTTKKYVGGEYENLY
jgi:hypothetical protein